MRRIALLVVASAALVAPAAALAAQAAANDGTLVIQKGDAPFVYKNADEITGTPVVRLTITGSVIGQIAGQGRIIIDGGAKSSGIEVVGGGPGKDVPQSDTAKRWDAGADGLKFRAVGGGTYTIVIYGGGVSLVAVGQGTAVLAGTPNTPKGDGRYSLNGDDWKSLPGLPAKQQLAIGLNG